MCNEGCWKPFRLLRAERAHVSIQLTSNWQAVPPTPPPFHQLAPVLAYALYLHEQRLIPGVIAQLSKQISQTSSQRDPCLIFRLSVGWGFIGKWNKIHVHHHRVVVIIHDELHFAATLQKPLWRAGFIPVWTQVCVSSVITSNEHHCDDVEIKSEHARGISCLPVWWTTLCWTSARVNMRKKYCDNVSSVCVQGGCLGLAEISECVLTYQR